VWPAIIAMGACGSLGHMCYIRAFALSDASAVMPYDYTRLMFAAAIGYFAFAEVPDVWTWAGTAIIACSALYIAHREAMVKRTVALTATGDDAARKPKGS
jgi:drug/metabolite transporter (DMT)-like permease